MDHRFRLNARCPNLRRSENKNRRKAAQFKIGASAKNYAPALHSFFAPSRTHLRGGTRHVPVGAEHAAILVYRLQHSAAPLALIKVLARVLVHTFTFVMTAARTHYRGYQLNHDWPRIGKIEDAP